MINFILQFFKTKPKSTNKLSPKYNPIVGEFIKADDGLLTLEVMRVWNNKARVRVAEVDSFWHPDRFRQQNGGYGLVINEEFDIETSDGRSDWLLDSRKPWYILHLNSDGVPVLTHYR